LYLARRALNFYSMQRLFAIGRCFFSAAIIGSGFQQLVTGDFVRIVPKLPNWIPWPSLWPYFVGVVLIVIGGAIISGCKAKRASGVLCAMLVLTFLFQRVPQIAANPLAGFVWTNPLKVLALLGGAITLASTESPSAATTGGWHKNSRLSIGPWLLGCFLFVCGAQHFIYAAFVDTLVPGWIPPTRRFWTYFAGVCLVAGGLGLFTSRTRHLAATLSGIMIILWVVLVHIPLVVNEINKAFEMAGVFEALAMSGVAFLVAGTCSRDRPDGAMS
jgi:uncharacterized membrane protein